MFDFAYSYSALLIDYIIYLYDKNSIKVILDNIKDGTSFETAFSNATLSSLDSFNQIVIDRIYFKYKLLNFIKFPNYLLIFAPIILFIGYVIKIRRNRVIIKQWELEELLDDIDGNEEDIS